MLRKKNIPNILTACWLSLVAVMVSHYATAQEIPEEAPTIRVVSDYWCPYSCTPLSSREGYMIDLLRALLAEEGYRLVYEMLPWNRALEMTRNGEADMIAGITRTEAEPGISLLHHSWGKHRFGFYSLSMRGWHYKGLDSLKTIRLGAIPSYSYGPPIDDYLVEYRQNSQKIAWTQGDYGMAVLTERLRQKDIDAFIENELVVDYWLRVNRQEDIDPVGFVEPDREHRNLYLGIGSQSLHQEKLHKILDKWLPVYRQDGRLQQLLSLYHLKDWETSNPPRSLSSD